MPWPPVAVQLLVPNLASPWTPSAPLRYFNVSDIDDYYKKKDPKPLIFCHFARGLADKAYDEVADYASLYKTLMEALNGEQGCFSCVVASCV